MGAAAQCLTAKRDAWIMCLKMTPSVTKDFMMLFTQRQLSSAVHLEFPSYKKLF